MSLPTTPDRKTVLEASEEAFEESIERLEEVIKTLYRDLWEIQDELAELSCP